MNSLTELFHVSGVPLELSWQATKKRMTWADPVKEEIESTIEAQKPADLPSRRVSYFAFPTIEECAYYADMENIGPERHFYTVKLISAVRAPFTLNAVPAGLEAYRDAIYRHYWNADDGWKFHEYFGERMIVRSEHTNAIPDFMFVHNRVMDDRNRLKALAATWA